MNTYHILNGDALKEQFPGDQTSGEIIVARECFVDGPIQPKNLQELFKVRETFIREEYGHGGYPEEVIPEIQKIVNIQTGEVNLWFEEDLFCQANLWFVCSQLYLKKIDVNLVLPSSDIQYGFGGMSQAQLVDAFQSKNSLTQINVNQFALLWFAYRNDDIERLLKLAVQMHAEFPFVMKAVEAHFDRLPKEGQPGKPEQLILEIMEEKSTTDFGIVFKEFHKRAPIYGFGDLQVKRIFDQIRTK